MELQRAETSVHTPSGPALQGDGLHPGVGFAASASGHSGGPRSWTERIDALFDHALDGHLTADPAPDRSVLPPEAVARFNH